MDSIDYVTWRSEHRDWFAREFPWVFEAQKVLKERHGIDADYIELLMVSGDIWQFNYPVGLGQPIPVFHSAGVRRIAAYYGITPALLLECIGPDAFDASGSRLPPRQTEDQIRDQCPADATEPYGAAVRRWQADVSRLKRGPDTATAGGSSARRDSELLVFTLRAGVYLTRTRTAAWIWARGNPEKSAEVLAGRPDPRLDSRDPKVLREWLDRLRDQVAAAERLGQVVPDLLTSVESVGCESSGDALTAGLSAVVNSLGTEDGND